MGQDVNFGKPILAFDRNFSTLNISRYISGLGGAGGQRSLWAEGSLRKGLNGIVIDNHRGCKWRWCKRQWRGVIVCVYSSGFSGCCVWGRRGKGMPWIAHTLTIFGH